MPDKHLNVNNALHEQLRIGILCAERTSAVALTKQWDLRHF